MLGNEDMVEKVEKVLIGDKVDSDHLLITVWIRTREQRKKKRKRKEEIKGKRGVWIEKEREEFVRKFGRNDKGEEKDEKDWE